MVDTIIDRKGNDIALLDIRDQAVFADYFLICSGESDRQLRALARSITTDAKEEANVQARGIEGEAENGWILIDFGDLVVHLFSPDTRNYYDLEELWHDAHVVLRMQ